MLFSSFDFLGMHSTTTTEKIREDKKIYTRSNFKRAAYPQLFFPRATAFLLGKVTNTLSNRLRKERDLIWEYIIIKFSLSASVLMLLTKLSHI